MIDLAKLPILSKEYESENGFPEYLEVIELVKGLNQEEYEVFAFDNNVESDDADQMMDFIGSLSKKEAKDIIKQLSESATNEANAV